MPNYRYNTPDYMRQNHSNGCHVGGSNRTMPPSVSPSTPPVRAVIFTITTN